MTLFLSLVGIEALKVNNSMVFPDGDRSVEIIIQNVLITSTVTSMRHFNFRNQKEGETIDDVVAELTHFAKSSNFCDYIQINVFGNALKDIRNKIVSTDKLTSQIAVYLCRTSEVTETQMNTSPPQT